MRSTAYKAMLSAIVRAVEAAKKLRTLDDAVTLKIKALESALWVAEEVAFDTTNYSYSCIRGSWRFSRKKDGCLVASLNRDDRASFLLEVCNQLLTEYNEDA